MLRLLAFIILIGCISPFLCFKFNSLVTNSPVHRLTVDRRLQPNLRFTKSQGFGLKQFAVSKGYLASIVTLAKHPNYYNVYKIGFGSLISTAIGLIVKNLWQTRVSRVVPIDSVAVGAFGRVPYDDEYFSNWRLTDPNLLRRSFVEVIEDEMPTMVSVYQNRMKIHELSRLAASIGGLGVLLYVISTAYHKSRSYFQLSQQQNSIAGSGVGISAVRRGNRRRRLLENGVYVMDEFEDEIPKSNDSSLSPT